MAVVAKLKTSKLSVSALSHENATTIIEKTQKHPLFLFVAIDVYT